MTSLDFKRGTAVLACAASLAGSAAALTPGVAAADQAAAAGAAKGCGARTISARGTGGKTTKITASLIKVEGGATCAEAIKVIRGVVTKKLPKGWTVKRGGYKVPQGLTPQVATKGRKTVKFALPR